MERGKLRQRNGEEGTAVIENVEEERQKRIEDSRKTNSKNLRQNKGGKMQRRLIKNWMEWRKI
jgi:hypothetical protein